MANEQTMMEEWDSTYFGFRNRNICQGFTLIARKLAIQLESEIDRTVIRKRNSSRLSNEHYISETVADMKALIACKNISRKDQLKQTIRMYNQHRPPKLQLVEHEYIDFVLQLAAFQANKISQYLNPELYPGAVFRSDGFGVYTDVQETIYNITHHSVEGRRIPAYDASADDRELLLLLSVLSKIDDLLATIQRVLGDNAISRVRAEHVRSISGYPYFEQYLLALYDQYNFTSEYIPRFMSNYNQALFLRCTLQQLRVGFLKTQYSFDYCYTYPDAAILPIHAEIQSHSQYKEDEEVDMQMVGKILTKHAERLYSRLNTPGVHPDEVNVITDVLIILLIMYEQVMDEPFTRSSEQLFLNDRYFINTDYFTLCKKMNQG